MKLIVFIVLCLCFSGAQAQANYPLVSSQFQRFYNEQTPDSIFSLYSNELKDKISQSKTEAIISGLHIQFGDLRSLKLMRVDSGFNIYKADFAHQSQCLLLELNDENMINGYRLMPYDPKDFDPKKQNH